MFKKILNLMGLGKDKEPEVIDAIFTEKPVIKMSKVDKIAEKMKENKKRTLSSQIPKDQRKFIPFGKNWLEKKCGNTYPRGEDSAL